MFNLLKHSQTPEGVGSAFDGAADAADLIIGNDPAADPIIEDALIDVTETPEQEALIDPLAAAEVANYINTLRNDPTLAEATQTVIVQLLNGSPSEREIASRLSTPQALESIRNQAEEAGIGGVADMASQSQRVLDEQNQMRLRVLETKRLQDSAAPAQNIAFNLKKQKTAQFPAESRFPVENVGEFIAKFLDNLLGFNPQPQGPEEERAYQLAKQAFEEIQGVVSPGFENEVDSALESIIQLDPVEGRDRAQESLMKIYNIMLPESVKGQSQMQPAAPQPQQMLMEPVMSDIQPEGIVKFNLSDQVLNNNKYANDPKVVKTAADQFGQEYLLYGPTEKRVCPKLRGKNLSVGDIVSEHTCRHHCLAGIVIDDNKTICGEALWRAHGMDKFSREYVNAEGEIVGGYLNKRFEINRNVDPENNMRLKPGETRKPRPASQGSLEQRMQAMRAAEGKERNYRPDVNTGDAFKWCSDVDQNNVEVPQAERDKREEASGHKTVQYENKLDFANNPKIAQNWNTTTDNNSDEGNAIGNWNGGWLNGEWKCPMCGTMIGRNLRGESPYALVEQHKLKHQHPENPIMSSMGFNLKHSKTAQGNPGVVTTQKPRAHSDREGMDPKLTHPGRGKSVDQQAKSKALRPKASGFNFKQHKEDTLVDSKKKT